MGDSREINFKGLLANMHLTSMGNTAHCLTGSGGTVEDLHVIYQLKKKPACDSALIMIIFFGKKHALWHGLLANFSFPSHQAAG